MARVIVLGGGVAGLSAAHELVERGYEVVVVEKSGIPGGKARSAPIMPTGPSPWSALPRYPKAQPTDTVAWIPGEHGFRFFPGFYQHVVDTMTRIPTPTGQTAAEHLVPTARCGLTQYNKRTFNFPMRFPRTAGDLGSALSALVAGLSPVTDLTVDDIAFFCGRIWQIATSCSERRLEEYEKISWWKFIDAENRSVAYKKFLGAGITRSLVAAHAETASTRTIGNIFIQLLLDILDPMVSTSDRVLDGPTNQVWIYPWLNHIRQLGAVYLPETEVTSIQCSGGRITGVQVRSEAGSELLHGDYYVCALPVERAAALLNPDLIAADGRLEGIRELTDRCLEWMNGIQFYFRKPVRLVRGHMNHIDTEWALTSISQVDVWRPGTMDRYGPRNIQGIVSVDVSDWDAPAPNGRSATEHTREEVCQEVWRQLKKSVNVDGDEILRDEDLIGWFIDSAIDRDPTQPGRLKNTEPLLVNLVDTWRLRPEAATAIPNFFLAADYVRTNTDLATMEAANEAARRAVNAILERSGSTATPCEIWPLHEPTALAPLRQYDAVRFGLGLDWDASMVHVGSAAMQAADPLLQPLSSVFARLQPWASKTEHVIDTAESMLPMREVEQATQPLLHQAQKSLESAEAAIPSQIIESSLLDAARRHAASFPFVGIHPHPSQSQAESAGPADFSDRLQWYRAMTMTALEDGVPTSEPRAHLYDPIREFVSRPSKGLRPALCLATCGAHGGNLEEAKHSAAGIELLHNAFLVHDDIEDGSESRRGGPTMHRMLGLPLAVNAGDAMNALSVGVFRRNLRTISPEAALRIFDEVDHMLIESLEGQAMELGWIRENNCDVATEDYLRLVLKKTAWYSFIHPMRIGALVARPEDEDLDRFNAFGFLLGAAFQIQDDVLNLMGDEALYGKEIGGDIWEGKRSLPVARALARTSGRDRSRLVEFFGAPRERRLTRQVLEISDILQQSGSLEWSRQVAQELSTAASEALPVAFAGASEGPDLNFIRSLSRYLVERAV